MRCEIRHSHRGVWHCVSAKRIFTCLLMHRHNCRASWFKISNRTGTTESMGDFFLFNLRKTRMLVSDLCPETRITWRASKLHSSKSDTAVVLIQWLVYFCKSLKVPSVFFPRGTLQYQTSSEWLKCPVARGLCHKHDSAGFSLDR